MTHPPLYPNLALNSHFKNLDKGMQQVLDEHLKLVRLVKNDVLFRQGDAGDAAYIVVNGRLRIIVTLPDGSERVVDESGPGLDKLPPNLGVSGYAFQPCGDSVRALNLVV